jgi:uncharacterized YceG family protein
MLYSTHLMKVKLSISLIALCAVFVGTMILHYHVAPSDLLSLSFYQNLANPSVRIVYIQPGQRQEQVATTLANTLGWNATQQKEFANAHLALGIPSLEGYYFPKTYLINENTDPVAVSKMMVDTYNTQVKTIKTSKTTKVVNQATILKIASIIQREAAGPKDMPLISGIIWNRIFMGMKLQLDATVQYAVGTTTNWWPVITPTDEKIDSPYNTYQTANLPPTPISNASLAAIAAAANPQPTNCLFYIHDKNRVIHCSATYQGQLNNIAKYY